MNEITAILHGTAILPDQELPDSLVLLEGERIARVEPFADDRVPAGARRYDARGALVLPGLIDTHVHGTHGDDVMTCGEEGLRRICARFPRYGVTSWLPSTIAALHEELLRAVECCASVAATPHEGAQIAGIHVEGPYINLQRKGAQPAEGIRDPNLDEMEELLDAAEGGVRIVTLAPELPGAHELIRMLVREGVIASIGHTDATYDEALVAVDAGASHATHLFNAMRPLHHRDPGVIAACLNEPEIVAEVIPDGIHLHPHIVRLALRTKGPDGVALITDAFSATGLPDGEYGLGPHRVRVAGPLCTLADGTIAGSILTMERAVTNAVAFAGVSLVDAVRMASLVPARLAACSHRTGSLEAGKDADVTVLSRDGLCLSTWVRGRQVWETPAP